MNMPFPDIPRLYTAIAEWLACMVYIAQLPLRIRGWKLAGVSVGMLVVQCVFLVVTGDAPLFLWIPCMIAAIGLMLVLFCACCNLPVLDACYHCMRAFLLAEFAAALEWQLYFYALFRLGWYSKLWDVLCLIVIYSAVFSFIYLLEYRRRDSNRHFKVTLRETGSAVAIGLAVFLMSNLSYSYSNTPFSSGFVTDIFNTRTLVDLGGLAILYAYHVQRGELHMRYEWIPSRTCCRISMPSTASPARVSM